MIAVCCQEMPIHTMVRQGKEAFTTCQHHAIGLSISKLWKKIMSHKSPCLQYFVMTAENRLQQYFIPGSI